MRRNTPVGSLQGQLLFAELESGTLTLDCVLMRAGGVAAAPVTFAAKFPQKSRSRQLAIELLNEWANGLVPVEVTISDGRGGARVEIATSLGRVVLEPDTAAFEA